MSKKTYKRELIEWAVLIVAGLTLYFTGLHTEVIGGLQRLVLATGLIRPDTEESSDYQASYDFKLTDYEGHLVNGSEFSGKTVFLNFWATWCPPCVAELPDIDALYEQMGDEVAFVLISVDKDPETARQFMAKKGYQVPVYFLADNLPAAYNPSSIPTTYVLSPEGKILVTQHGMAKYNSDKFKNFLRKISSSGSGE